MRDPLLNLVQEMQRQCCRLDMHLHVHPEALEPEGRLGWLDSAAFENRPEAVREFFESMHETLSQLWAALVIENADPEKLERMLPYFAAAADFSDFERDTPRPGDGWKLAPELDQILEMIPAPAGEGGLANPGGNDICSVALSLRRNCERLRAEIREGNL